MHQRISRTVEDFIELPSKPGYRISIRIITDESYSDERWLVVFINGLKLPAESWKGAIDALIQLKHEAPVSLLTYDRFKQGRTIDEDPLDSRPSQESGYGHDITNCAQDLFELVTKLRSTTIKCSKLRLVLVAASVGAHIARVFASSHHQLVEGILFLDSNIGHLEYSDLWPNPQDPAFDADGVLEDDCTLDQYIKSTTLLGEMFNSDAKNAEGLDRRNIKRLLPSAYEPSLAVEDYGPWISVLGHDPMTFADQTLEGLGVPRSLSMKFINPEWTKYNQQLLGLTTQARQLGFSIAQGCGHFIQKDNPQLVAQKLLALLQHCIRGLE